MQHSIKVKTDFDTWRGVISFIDYVTENPEPRLPGINKVDRMLWQCLLLNIRKRLMVKLLFQTNKKITVTFKIEECLAMYQAYDIYCYEGCQGYYSMREIITPIHKAYIV